MEEFFSAAVENGKYNIAKRRKIKALRGRGIEINIDFQ